MLQVYNNYLNCDFTRLW